MVPLLDSPEPLWFKAEARATSKASQAGANPAWAGTLPLPSGPLIFL